MISVDGRATGMEIKQFHNLEEILLQIMDGGELEGRVVTDVIVNNESFSEIYPHQAEDIEVEEITSVEVKSVPVVSMALDIATELDKVVVLMDHGARRVADLFRQAEDAEALEVYQDLMDVTRDFLNMIGVLRGESLTKESSSFDASADEISNLFSEMLEVLENEDWILLADLLEYEFIPAMGRWKVVIAELRENFRGIREE
ncbi:conserved hypothetical protein [Solidesulfovibrio fructosivorans JJ]]|uniref:Uncharacterized protein n=1 Tax=Solidesulfovibrio fructosivorans JJ] TaxID=596151 RepID=E1JZ18_SOLFR|nr:hypothetical protein [Solidesulfovibrio fructosivorans]EFL50434.1 conserved hypothetical protein [Solidesulfovibrio fructosivorans JJ]]